MVVVCCVNGLKCVCIIYTAILYGQEHDLPLSTIGDAIVSFMSKSDPTTERMCLVGKSKVQTNPGRPSDFLRRLTARFSRQKVITPDNRSTWQQPGALEWDHSHPRWFKAASRRRWCCTIMPLVKRLWRRLQNADC
jgi:hypothetical protein